MEGQGHDDAPAPAGQSVPVDWAALVAGAEALEGLCGAAEPGLEGELAAEASAGGQDFYTGLVEWASNLEGLADLPPPAEFEQLMSHAGQGSTLVCCRLKCLQHLYLLPVSGSPAPNLYEALLADGKRLREGERAGADVSAGDVPTYVVYKPEAGKQAALKGSRGGAQAAQGGGGASSSARRVHNVGAAKARGEWVLDQAAWLLNLKERAPSPLGHAICIDGLCEVLQISRRYLYRKEGASRISQLYTVKRQLKKQRQDLPSIKGFKTVCVPVDTLMISSNQFHD